MSNLKNSCFSDQEMVDVLRDLVNINTSNGNEIKTATYIKTLLEKFDINATIIPITDSRVDLVAEIGNGEPVLGISGHMDVVPAGDENNWNSDPFILDERDNKLYGRGTSDMKSGLAAMIIAMIQIKENNLLSRGTIRLMATMGEEVGELGSQKLYEDGYMDDVDALVIGEPSGYMVVYAHKGSMDIKLKSKGKAAHSSLPEEGYNAIDPLISLLNKANKLFKDSNKQNSLLGKATFSTTIIEGGNQVNSIPEFASSEMNIRTIPEFDNKEVEKIMEDLVHKQNEAGAEITMDIYMSQPSVETDSNSSLVKLSKDLGTKYAGFDVEAVAIPPVTDASNLLKGKSKSFPLAIFGPGSDTPHKVDEYVDKQMYLDFICLYVDLFTSYLK
ncbi:MAG: ArgE/DapE family deacylase [Pediococcus acidilactici]|nr:ArgE/DapE family deacylase [Pediococcus acidilactici]